MLKKTYLVSAYNGLQQCSVCCSTSPCISSTSPQSLPAQRARPQPCLPNKRRRLAEPSSWILKRSYATVRDGKGMDFRDNMNWPCRYGQSAAGANPFVPSPYEIFDMQKTARYGKQTKLKYYELVKIYHPDRAGLTPGSQELSQTEQLERYRLIVLAHEILSDPEKRRAYDSIGAGWGARNQATRYTRGYSSTAPGQQYGQGEGFDSSPFANATWEDWERWYRRQSTSEQRQAYQGIYVNPNAFAAFIILAAILSGVLQATRISSSLGTFEDKQLAFTEETSRFMTARASQFDENKLNSEGRVRHFLEKRDPTRYGLKEEEEEQYRKHFHGNEDVPPIGRNRQGASEKDEAHGHQ